MVDPNAPATVGLVAGGGDLPRRLIESCKAQGRPIVVVALKGHADKDSFEDIPHVWLRLGAASDMLAFFHEHGVEEVVLAGTVKRPGLLDVMPDARAARFLAQVGRKAMGDDGLNAAIAKALEEEEGFRVIGPDDLLGDLRAERGIYTKARPDEEALADIARGVQVLRALGDLDVGQAVVIQQGMVLGIEAIEGTAALLRRAGELRRNGPGGVLVKLKKPNQEKRLDLPAVGPDTVEGAVGAGLRGIAVEAEGALIVDRARVIAACDADGLFLTAVDPDAPTQ